MNNEHTAEHTDFSVTTYVVIFVLLALLTLLTVAISFLDLSAGWHLTLGLSVATVKASLVLLFFMHVLHSTAQTRVVIAAALLWLAILYALTLTDYLTRGQIPRMPGH